MLKAEVTVPKLRPRYVNERETITAMTQRLAARIIERTRAGQGVSGALPRGKGDNAPMNRTGALLALFGAAVQERDGRVSGVVRAFGSRPAHERLSIQKKTAAARARTAQLRAAAVVGGFLRHQATGDPVVGRRSRGRGISLSRIRVRTVTNNGALAAILSVPPKDRRSINGNRGVYRVFEARDSEQAELGVIARGMLVVELVGA